MLTALLSNFLYIGLRSQQDQEYQAAAEIKEYEQRNEQPLTDAQKQEIASKFNVDLARVEQVKVVPTGVSYGYSPGRATTSNVIPQRKEFIPQSTEIKTIYKSASPTERQEYLETQKLQKRAKKIYYEKESDRERLKEAEKTGQEIYKSLREKQYQEVSPFISYKQATPQQQELISEQENLYLTQPIGSKRTTVTTKGFKPEIFRRENELTKEERLQLANEKLNKLYAPLLKPTSRTVKSVPIFTAFKSKIVEPTKKFIYRAKTNYEAAKSSGMPVSVGLDRLATRVESITVPEKYLYSEPKTILQSKFIGVSSLLSTYAPKSYTKEKQISQNKLLFETVKGGVASSIRNPEKPLSAYLGGKFLTTVSKSKSTLKFMSGLYNKYPRRTTTIVSGINIASIGGYGTSIALRLKQEQTPEAQARKLGGIFTTEIIPYKLGSFSVTGKQKVGILTRATGKARIAQERFITSEGKIYKQEALGLEVENIPYNRKTLPRINRKVAFVATKETGGFESSFSRTVSGSTATTGESYNLLTLPTENNKFFVQSVKTIPLKQTVGVDMTNLGVAPKVSNKVTIGKTKFNVLSVPVKGYIRKNFVYSKVKVYDFINNKVKYVGKTINKISKGISSVKPSTRLIKTPVTPTIYTQTQQIGMTPERSFSEPMFTNTIDKKWYNLPSKGVVLDRKIIVGEIQKLKALPKNENLKPIREVIRPIKDFTDNGYPRIKMPKEKGKITSFNLGIEKSTTSGKVISMSPIKETKVEYEQTFKPILGFRKTPQLFTPSVSFGASQVSTPIMESKASFGFRPAQQTTPTLSFKPSLASTPSLSIKPALALSPSLAIKPALALSPSLAIKPALALQPALDIKPALEIKPILEVKPKLSLKPTFRKTPPIITDLDLFKKPSVEPSPSFNVQIRRSGTFKTVGYNLPRGKALEKGSMFARRTLAATFRLVPSTQYTTQKDISFSPPSNIFRSFMIRGKKRIPLQDTFIQLRSKRLSSRFEVGEIKSFRRGLF